MRHKVVDHKVIIRQITIISYSTVIQTKLYIFRQRNDRKVSNFNIRKINKAKQHVLQKYNIYCEPAWRPHHKLKALMV